MKHPEDSMTEALCGKKRSGKTSLDLALPEGRTFFLPQASLAFLSHLGEKQCRTI